MYCPRSFRVDDTDQLGDFMRRYSFCTLITPDSDDLSISHLPVLVDRVAGQFVLTGHLAAANPHAAILDRRRSTAIFHGPHSYISPAWYAETGEVPTWNYASVHASGQSRIFKDPQTLSAVVDRMTETYESLSGGAWDRKLPVGYRARLLNHIVGFELTVDEIGGKYKLGQNRTQADQDSMLAHLESSPHEDSRGLAVFIRRVRGHD